MADIIILEDAVLGAWGWELALLVGIDLLALEGSFLGVCCLEEERRLGSEGRFEACSWLKSPWEEGCLVGHLGAIPFLGAGLRGESCLVASWRVGSLEEVSWMGHSCLEEEHYLGFLPLAVA